MLFRIPLRAVALKLLAPYRISVERLIERSPIQLNLSHEPFDDVASAKLQSPRSGSAIAGDLEDRRTRKNFLRSDVGLEGLAKAEFLEKEVAAPESGSKEVFPMEWFSDCEAVDNRTAAASSGAIVPRVASVLNINTEITITPGPSRSPRFGLETTRCASRMSSDQPRLTNIRALFNRTRNSAESCLNIASSGSANSSAVANGERTTDKNTNPPQIQSGRSPYEFSNPLFRISYAR